MIGAVANPMFSLALWFARAIRGSELLFDWLGQFLGALFGALVLFGLNDADRFVTGVNGWQPGDSVPAGVDLDVHVTGYANLGIAIGAELLVCTLVVVVLLSAIWEHRSNAAAAAFVGGAVTLGSLFLYPISGAGLNPARSLAMAIFADTRPQRARPSVGVRPRPVARILRRPPRLAGDLRSNDGRHNPRQRLAPKAFMSGLGGTYVPKP